MNAAVLVLLAALLGAQHVLETSLVNALGPRNLPAATTEADRVPPMLMKAASFGQLPSVVDTLWLRVHSGTDVYHGPKRTDHDPRDPLYYQFDLITELDPLNQVSYIAGSIFLTIVRKDPPSAVRLLEKGQAFMERELPAYSDGFRSRFWDRGWDLLTQLGYNYLYELNEVTRASRVLLKASRLPDAPAYLGLIAARVSQPDGAYQLGLRMLNGQINVAREGPLKEELLKKRFHLFVGQFVFNLNRDFQEYLGKQPDYRSRPTIPAADMEKYWKRFMVAAGITNRDPFGGALSLEASTGRILTSTPHDRVLGLE